MKVDVTAYQKERLAQADQKSAENKSKAVLIAAEAEKQASLLRAEGAKANEMVPVEVERKKVEVKQAEEMIPVSVSKEMVQVKAAEVEVTKKDLAYRTDYEKISVDLKVQLAKIEADKEVRIAMAKSMAEALKGSNMTIWGDPSTVAKMSEAFLKGQSYGYMLDGVVEGTPASLKGGLKNAGQAVKELFKHFGKDSEIKEKIYKVAKELGIDLESDEEIIDVKSAEKKQAREKSKQETVDEHTTT